MGAFYVVKKESMELRGVKLVFLDVEEYGKTTLPAQRVPGGMRRWHAVRTVLAVAGVMAEARPEEASCEQRHGSETDRSAMQHPEFGEGGG